MTKDIKLVNLLIFMLSVNIKPLKGKNLQALIFLLTIDRDITTLTNLIYLVMYLNLMISLSKHSWEGKSMHDNPEGNNQRKRQMDDWQSELSSRNVKEVLEWACQK